MDAWISVDLRGLPVCAGVTETDGAKIVVGASDFDPCLGGQEVANRRVAILLHRLTSVVWLRGARKQLQMRTGLLQRLVLDLQCLKQAQLLQFIYAAGTAPPNYLSSDILLPGC